MKKTPRPISWIIELDYDADPETTPETVRAIVEDELSVSDSANIDGNLVTVEIIQDAFKLRMRLDENIKKIIPQFA